MDIGEVAVARLVERLELRYLNEGETILVEVLGGKKKSELCHQ